MSTVHIAQSGITVKSGIIRCSLKLKAQMLSWVERSEASGNAQLALRVLVSYTSHVDGTIRAWPSQGLLARKMHCSIETVKRAIKKLIDLGLISRLFRYDTKGKRTSNFYILNTTIKKSENPVKTTDVAASKPVETRCQNSPGLRVQEIPYPRLNSSIPFFDEGVARACVRETAPLPAAAAVPDEKSALGVLRKAAGWLFGTSPAPAIAVDRTVLETDPWSDLPEFGPEHAALGWRGVCHG